MEIGKGLAKIFNTSTKLGGLIILLLCSQAMLFGYVDLVKFLSVVGAAMLIGRAFIEKNLEVFLKNK